MDPAVFLRILQRLPWLRSLDFVNSLTWLPVHLLTKEVVLHLSQAPHLVRVTALEAVSTDCLTHALQHNAHPFARTRSLGIVVESAAVPLLARLFPFLTLSLRLRVLDDEHGVFAHLVAWVPRLRHLVLTLPSRCRLTPDDIGVLERLTQLRTLDLGAVSGQPVARWFTDRELVDLLRALPHLERFRFDVDHWLSTHALVLVGQHAPQLTSLTLSGICDLRTLTMAPAPLFPRLASLKLSSILMPGSFE